MSGPIPRFFNLGHILLVASLLTVAGCATTSPRRPAVPDFSPAARIQWHGISYLSAEAVQARLHGGSRWDPDGQIWNLSAGFHELRVAPQIPVALVDGLPLVLAEPPVMQAGVFYLPESLWQRELAAWERPAAAPAAPTPARPIRTIVVDAGHGGKDPGAIGRTGLREKEITLDIAKRLRDLLVRDGFHVVMTRYDDRFIALDRRTVIANEERADLFVSVHANASKSRSVEGYEVYYLSEATDDHARAVAASENAQLPSEVEGGLALSVPESTLPIVWDLLYTEHRAESTALAGSVAQGIRGAGVSTPNRGVKSARFFVLKGTRMPAVLVEVGFISSLREEDRLRSAGYRQQLAEGIRNGILSYRKRHEQES